jgi:hypothetical protein
VSECLDLLDEARLSLSRRLERLQGRDLPGEVVPEGQAGQELANLLRRVGLQHTGPDRPRPNHSAGSSPNLRPPITGNMQANEEQTQPSWPVLRLRYPNGRTYTHSPTPPTQIQVGAELEIFGRRWTVKREIVHRSGQPANPRTYECWPLTLSRRGH